LFLGCAFTETESSKSACIENHSHDPFSLAL
jgi:hypothetical protein